MTDTADRQTPHEDAGDIHPFQAEVTQLLRLMVHSVYSEQEVFLRELISNAADACDKLRYHSITEPSLLGADTTFRIVITVDNTAGTITIADNGIGMTKDELVENLGTIAHSGTRRFVEQMTGDAAKDAKLIGQFGVGFYSAFMVADRVDVISRKAGESKAHVWSSDGSGGFTVAPADDEAALLAERGTAVAIKLRTDARDYLDPERIGGIVRTYSDHIGLPIHVRASVSEPAGDPVNSTAALWTLPRKEISKEQYAEFYHHVGHMLDEPWMTIHYKAEGKIEYTSLLYIPSTRPFDLFDPARTGRTKLYVKRVFITDDAALLPPWLRFVRGVVDSEDMPLNLSREMLQNNPIVAKIRQALTKRILNELKKRAEKDPAGFETFWEAFGPVLKEGLYEDPAYRADILALARFRTSKSPGTWRTLDQYVADLPDGQTAIYYITGDHAGNLAKSPQIEGYRARGIEVLLLSDPVDDFWTGLQRPEFDGKPFKSVTRGADDLSDIGTVVPDDEAPDEVPDDSELGTLIAAMKQVLGDEVKDVRRSERLRDSACCLVAEDGGPDMHLARIIAGHNGGGADVPVAIMEINPRHAVIRRLAASARAKGVVPEVADAVRLLFDQARIVEGQSPADPASFARRLAAFMEKGLSD